MNQPHTSAPRSFLYIERNDYTCDLCGVKFNWDINSRFLANWKQVDEGQTVPTFCCEGHAQEWQKQHPQS